MSRYGATALVKKSCLGHIGHILRTYFARTNRRWFADAQGCAGAERAPHCTLRSRSNVFGPNADGPYIRQTSVLKESLGKVRLRCMVIPQIHSAPPCQICRTPMTLVFVEPKVASFSDLHLFRCFACGDMRSIEQRASDGDEKRPSFFD